MSKFQRSVLCSLFEMAAPQLIPDEPIWHNPTAASEYHTLVRWIKSPQVDADVKKQMQARLVHILKSENKVAYSVYVAFGLGLVFGLGLGLTFMSETLQTFGLYMILVAIFHMWEYTFVVLFHGDELSRGSRCVLQLFSFMTHSQPSC